MRFVPSSGDSHSRPSTILRTRSRARSLLSSSTDCTSGSSLSILFKDLIKCVTTITSKVVYDVASRFDSLDPTLTVGAGSQPVGHCYRVQKLPGDKHET